MCYRNDGIDRTVSQLLPVDNRASEPHRAHTSAEEETVQLLNDGRLYEPVDEVILLLLFYVPVILCDVDVALVVVVEFDQRPVDRPTPEVSVPQGDKAAKVMCV